MNIITTLSKLLPSLGRGLGVGLLLASCSPDADETYSHLRARLVVQTVAACPALNMAVGNSGQWCSVTAGNNNTYTVKGSKTTSTMNLTQMTGYQGFYLGIAGLIIGMPNIPEMGHDAPRVTCYDLACPNCYRDYSIAKVLTVSFDGGTATCPSCARRYDLNNCGFVATDQGGHPLERYRVMYNGTSLTVSN